MGLDPSNPILSEGLVAKADEVGVSRIEVRVGDWVLLEQPVRDQMHVKAPLTSKHTERCHAGPEELPENCPKPQERFSFGLLEIIVALG